MVLHEIVRFNMFIILKMTQFLRIVHLSHKKLSGIFKAICPNFKLATVTMGEENPGNTIWFLFLFHH